MGWTGNKIKELANINGISITKIADLVDVSRQTVNDWINGQIPKGNHLLELSKILNVSPNIFFSKGEDKNIIIPLHRVRNNSKITDNVQKEALDLVEEFKLFFKNSKIPPVLPVIRLNKIDEKRAEEIAKELKENIKYQDFAPINFDKTFKLLEMLGIYLVFTNFPIKVKSYAFFTKIYGNRVVFINNNTNIIDLIFPLLHEAIHAVRDELTSEMGYDENEEELCDEIASHIQFSDEYISLVYNAIKGLPNAIQVKKLKDFGKGYKHSLHGVVKRIKKIDDNFELEVGGADSNLKKQYPTIGELRTSADTVRRFIELEKKLSPHYFNSILEQLNNLSDRKLAFLLGIEENLDVIEIRKELMAFGEK